MARVDGFTLGKQVRVALLVAHFLRAKVNPFAGLGTIGDGHACFLVHWNGCDERDDEFISGRLPALDGLGGSDRKNGQVHCIEAQFLHGHAIGFELKKRLALEGALLEIRRQI